MNGIHHALVLVICCGACFLNFCSSGKHKVKSFAKYFPSFACVNFVKCRMKHSLICLMMMMTMTIVGVDGDEEEIGLLFHLFKAGQGMWDIRQ